MAKNAYERGFDTTIFLHGDLRQTIRDTRRRRLIFGAKLKAWRLKMFMIYFHFLQSDIVFGLQILFREYSMPKSEKGGLCDFNAFPIKIHGRQVSIVFLPS